MTVKKVTRAKKTEKSGKSKHIKNRLPDQSEWTFELLEQAEGEIQRIADRITVMVNGTVIANGTPDVIRNHAAVRSAYLGDH